MNSKFDAATIAAALETSERSIQRRAVREKWPCLEEPVRGGRKRFYLVSGLPEDVQTKVLLHLMGNGESVLPDLKTPTQKSKRLRPQSDAESLWAWYESRPQSVKDEGARRAGVCLKVRLLLDAGVKVRPALTEVAKAEGVAEATLRRWWYGDSGIIGAANVDRADYAAALAPRHAGCQVQAELDPDAWEWIKADYLRPEKPALSAVYRRARSIAAKQGWDLPSQATIARRLEALPWQLVALAREGEEALKRRLPHITRLKSSLHALQTVNADGHVFDLRVTLPSGVVGRPVMVCWQDIYSGKVLAYRLGETLNQHIVRLAFGELVENWGVPEHVYLDNGREFANKWLTGTTKTRFRFTIREDDPVGIFPLLGCEVHWTTPYHGQSKPIERAFKDLCEGIAKHPAASGAYTGNSPVNKPFNYGSRTLTWEEFQAVVAEGIAEHNSRQGRRSEIALGRSFDDAFAESYAQSQIRKATAEQRRLWLLAAEGVTVRGSGHVALEKNLYWSEAAAGLVGRKVVVRFDSDRLDLPVHIYDLTGEYLGAAECTQANFMDSQAAKDHARANRQRVKSAKEQLKAERTMSAIEAAQRLPGVVIPMERPQAGAIAPMFERPRMVANGGYMPEEEGGSHPDESYLLSIMDRLPRRVED